MEKNAPLNIAPVAPVDSIQTTEGDNADTLDVAPVAPVDSIQTTEGDNADTLDVAPAKNPYIIGSAKN